MSISGIPRLHLISDSRICNLERFPDLARRAVAGGVDAVHLREKATPARRLFDTAMALRDVLGNRALLILNDRVDVALASAADGIQLGEKSLPVWVARSLVGDEVLIGRSVHDVSGANQAAEDGADFVIAGHVFETPSKQGQAGRGLQFVEEVVRACPIPVIAIGGITPERVAEVIRAGAHGIAVLSGILKTQDPEAAARCYTEAFKNGDEKRAVDDQWQAR